MSAEGIADAYEELRKAVKKTLPRDVACGKCFHKVGEFGFQMSAYAKKREYYRVDLKAREMSVLRKSEQTTLDAMRNEGLRKKGLLPDILIAAVLHDIKTAFPGQEAAGAFSFADPAESILKEQGVRWPGRTAYRMPLTYQEMTELMQEIVKYGDTSAVPASVPPAIEVIARAVRMIFCDDSCIVVVENT